MARPHFWHSALLYIYRPNLINRRYIGTQIIFSWFLEENVTLSCFESQSTWQDTSITDLQAHLKMLHKNGAIEVLDLIDGSRPILLLRKLFRKQSLKNLQKNATEPANQNDSEYDVIIIFPVHNLFALISIEFD